MRQMIVLFVGSRNKNPETDLLMVLHVAVE